MFVKRVSLLALASLALAQEHMGDMSGSEHNTAAAAAPMAPAESEMTLTAPYSSNYPTGATDYVSSQAVDTMETTLPETMAPVGTDMTMPPTTEEAAAPTADDYSMTTSVVPADPSNHNGMPGMAMPMPTGGMPMPNGTASPEPPISGSGVSGVSVSPFSQS